MLSLHFSVKITRKGVRVFQPHLKSLTDLKNWMKIGMHLVLYVPFVDFKKIWENSNRYQTLKYNKRLTLTY